MKFAEQIIASIFPCVGDVKKAVENNTAITREYMCIARVKKVQGWTAGNGSAMPGNKK